MLTISIKINGKEIAVASASNLSDLNDISNYWVVTNEGGDTRLGIPHKIMRGMIYRHQRKQSVWALVEKIARVAQRKRETKSALLIRILTKKHKRALEALANR